MAKGLADCGAAGPSLKICEVYFVGRLRTFLTLALASFGPRQRNVVSMVDQGSPKRRLGHVACHQAQRLAGHLPAEDGTAGLKGAQDETKLQK